MLHLLESSWLPVIRRATGPSLIHPAEITADHATDPVMALDWPRADLRIAGLEFLIGLLATACPPAGIDAWAEGWEAPPEPASLAAAFAPLAPAFALDGDGPRFMQDLDPLEGEILPVERLLIDIASTSAGSNTDLLARQGRIARLGRGAAAMALFTLQAWAPAGGRGIRTGLRGGGPLTTLAIPGTAPTLWQMLWANVPHGEPAPAEALPLIFPWLAPTRSSEGAAIVTPQNAHPLQCWWATPRRIRLDFTPAPTDAACDLTGRADAMLVTGWRQRAYGANYLTWLHPLSPRYRAKAGGEWLAVHPQPGGVGYRDWLGLVMEHPDGNRLPAAAVSTWRGGRAQDADCATSRLLAAGYDMTNAKAREFVESELPLPGAADPARQALLDDTARALVLATALVADLLRQAVRAALFGPGASVKFDAGLFAVARERLWQASEAGFFTALHDVARDGEPARAAALAAWPAILRRSAIALFDEAAPVPIDSSGAAPRISRARRNLGFALAGYGKQGRALFELLELSAPESRGKAKGKAA